MAGPIDEEVVRVLRELPAKESVSPRAIIARNNAAIDEAIRKGYTITEIAKILAKGTKVNVAASTLEQYIKQARSATGTSAGNSKGIVKQRRVKQTQATNVLKVGHSESTTSSDPSTQHAAARNAGRRP